MVVWGVESMVYMHRSPGGSSVAKEAMVIIRLACSDMMCVRLC